MFYNSIIFSHIGHRISLLFLLAKALCCAWLHFNHSEKSIMVRRSAPIWGHLPEHYKIAFLLAARQKWCGDGNLEIWSFQKCFNGLLQSFYPANRSIFVHLRMPLVMGNADFFIIHLLLTCASFRTSVSGCRWLETHWRLADMIKILCFTTICVTQEV